MFRVIRHTIWWGLTRRELWHGNRENLTNLLKRDPNDNIILWAWTHYRSYRQRYAEQAKHDSRVIRFGTPRKARLWLEQLDRE